MHCVNKICTITSSLYDKSTFESFAEIFAVVFSCYHGVFSVTNLNNRGKINSRLKDNLSIYLYHQ